MDPKYGAWLHAITILGYDEKITIPTEHKEIIDGYYKAGQTPECAFKLYKEYLELEDLKQNPWFQERPELIKQAILQLPPIYMYKFKESGKECAIYSYEEPKSGKLEDVTVTVQKTGRGGALSLMGLGALDSNMVFGVKFSDLERVNK